MLGELCGVLPGTCARKTFPCHSGQCVKKENAECDGRRDCEDGSDEVQCGGALLLGKAAATFRPSLFPDCGARPAMQTGNRIVGGSEALRGEFPWQVSLRENNEHFCGATILSATWLVSAAHCFNDFQDPGTWSAHAGSTWLSHPESSAVKAAVGRILKHPSYDADTADYDVALLELMQPLPFSRYIQPACIPASSHVFPPGRRCLISGWGYLREDVLVKPDLLQKATVEVLDQALCSSLYGNILTERMMCAGYLEGKIDSCQGDSGGPLVCEEPSGSFFLAGIVSWGIGCAEARRPGVYARVTQLRDWIQASMATRAPALVPLATTPRRETSTEGARSGSPTTAFAQATGSPAMGGIPVQACGLRPGFSKPVKIVGGLNASCGEVPWQASLKEGPQHFCGATIIGDRWLISAAHCFANTKVEHMAAFAGTTALSAVGGSSVKVRVQRVVTHPAYNAARLDFDVALLELTQPLPFGKEIQPICLPPSAQDFPVGRKCMISGWGSLHEGNAHYLGQAPVQHSHCLTWISGKREVELGIISILMVPQPTPPDDLSQRFHVDVEQQRGQNGPLQYSMA
ncbi:Transmembrane protease serine 9 [Varanus komodoensis]|nr:Transmembrane protease serine 9 [Varanus komodoensis]